jgi:hypothetical protein
MKFPKSMSACADLLYDKRTERLAADKVAAALKADEQALMDHIIDNLPKDSGGAVGKHHKIEVYVSSKLVVEDWDKLYAYIKRTGRFMLLQKRLGETAAQELIDDKKEVPGIGNFPVVKISLTARKK